MDELNDGCWKLIIGAVVAVVVVLVVIFGLGAFLKRVDPGNVGIVLHYSTSGGKPQITTVPTGSYAWINPFAGETLIEYPTAQQQLVLSSRSNEGELTGDSTIPCLMSGGGTLNIGLTVNWQVNSAHPDILYLKKPGVPLTSSLNNDINTTIVYGAVRSDLLDLCTRYTWQDVLGDGTGPSKSDQLKADLFKALQNDLGQDGIVVNQVFLNERNPDSTIQSVLNARNDAMKSAYLKQQAQYQADATVAKAQGDAKAISIINAQLANSPNYVNYLIAQKWDGHLPQVVSSNGQSSPVISALQGK
jgi:prohibitin 2